MAGINQINELTQSIGGKTAGAKKADNQDVFKNALTQALSQTKPTESPEMGNTTASALREIPSIGLCIQDISSIVSEKTESLLGMLDAYVSQLQDPGVSLKSIAPVLEQINTKADSLLKESVSLGAGNKDLKDIATQAVVAARTEYVKFQRGDYLS